MFINCGENYYDQGIHLDLWFVYDYITTNNVAFNVKEIMGYNVTINLKLIDNKFGWRSNDNYN